MCTFDLFVISRLDRTMPTKSLRQHDSRAIAKTQRIRGVHTAMLCTPRHTDCDSVCEQSRLASWQKGVLSVDECQSKDVHLHQ